jgi:predicted ArsR family transcriptional regulator
LTLLTAPVDRDLEARLPSRARDIVALLRRAGPLSTSDIGYAVRLSRPAVLRRLNALRDAELIEDRAESKGSARGGGSVLE